MSVSMPEFQFRVLDPPAAPGAFYARAMPLSTHSARLALTICPLEPGPPAETLLAWDATMTG